MKCIICGKKTIVLESRHQRQWIRRRHYCENCEQRFTTYETTLDLPKVIKEYAQLKRFYRSVEKWIGEIAK